MERLQWKGPTKIFDENQWLPDEQQIAIKRKLLGVEKKFPTCKPSQQVNENAPVLHAGTGIEAGFEPESIAAMRTVCREWYADAKEPFVALVARHGLIVFNEAFDDFNTGKTSIDTPMHMASITKTMSASLFAEFMDQGFASLADPVGKILPDFPLEGNGMFAWRAAFTHMAGIHAKAGTGREVHNAYSDDWVVNIILATVPSRRRTLQALFLADANSQRPPCARHTSMKQTWKALTFLTRCSLTRTLRKQNSMTQSYLKRNCFMHNLA